MMKFNELKPETLEKASIMLKAIAHPARIAIISLLEDGKRQTVSEIHKKLGMEQAVASHHLVILRDRGVLSSVREGKNILYYLRNPNFGNMLKNLSDCCQE